MKLSLAVLQGQNEVRDIPIRLTQFLIGRDPQCQLRPASPLISKRHCALIVREGKVFLRDFESTNGTVLNGDPLKGEAAIKDKDLIKVGPLTFRVKLTAPTPVNAPTPMPETAAGKKTPAPAAKSSRVVDEDSIADMLFNLQDDPGAAAGGAKEEVPVPSDSTVMDLPAPGPKATAAEAKQPDDTAVKEQTPPPEPKKPEKKKDNPEQGAAIVAAEAILKKYLSRPRT